MEGGALLRVIGEHVIGEILPIGMESSIILHPSLTVFVEMPLFLEIFECLSVSLGTLTF